MNDDELIQESVEDYGYFDRLRSNVGYGPTKSLTQDWTRGAARSMAEESMAKDDDFFNSYPFFMFDADARTAFMIDMNIGQLKSDQDRMTVASKDIERAQSLLDLISQLKLTTNNEDIAKILKTTDAYNGLLRDGKFDSTDITENLNKLKSIVDEANEDYQDAYEDQMTDLKDIEDWRNSHTVSGYYTRKSKQESKFGNWFYTMPSTQGLSSSSWKEQAMSLATGIGASAVASALIGGSVGSSVGPLGTAAGALAGAAIGVGSAILAQAFGGAQAREQESHMEAFDAYQNGLLNRLAESGVDIHEAATSIREQAKALNYPNLDALSDEDIIGMAAADTRFKYDFNGGLDFARAMDEAYVGTRRVYERNNALGAAEFATDIFMYTPLRALGVPSMFSKATGSVAKTAHKYNPISYLQDLTMKTNLDISKLAGKMRLRAMKHYGKGLLKRLGLNFIEESTEEGAQDIIQKEYAAGEYADEYASDDWTDAIFNGNMISDMTDNLLFRTESGLSWLGLSSQYGNDVQQLEQMWSGGLMALLSPQGAVMTAKNFADTYKGIKQAYGAGKYIEEALQKNADIGGIEAFYRNMRKYDIANMSSYQQVLDMLRDELKSAKTSKDGHTTRRWKLDTDAIHKIIGPVNPNITDSDGNAVRTNSELTDADIDEFIDGQAKMAQTLFKNKPDLDRAWKRIKNDFSGIEPRGKHTVEELNQLSDQITALEAQINSGTTGPLRTRQDLKKLKELKRKYKSYSKNAVDTDMQDAYYALSIMSMYDKKNAQLNRDALNASMNQVKLNLHNNIDYERLRTAIGIKSEVDNSLLFDLLWSNQNIRTLKLNRAKFEADFLAAQRAALNGNAPIELSRNQKNALNDIDELIEAEQGMRSYYKELIDTLDDKAKAEMTKLFNFGEKSAAQFSADEQTDTFNNTLQVAFNNSKLAPEDIVKYMVTRDETIGARMNAIRAESNLNTLINGDPKEIRALIEQYRKARNESFQSQQAAENEQSTGKPAEQQKFSSIKNWLAGATPEQIGDRIDEVDENLGKQIKLFDDFVAALPDSSPLSKSLNDALNFANAIQEAANGSKVSKIRALQYQLQDIRRQFEGSEDPQVREAVDMIDGMILNIIDMNILNDEAKARQTEYYIPGKFLVKGQKPIKTDNKTFTDNAGNLFTVDLSNSVYSNNNGLVLSLRQVNPNKEREKKQLRDDIKRINATIAGIKQDIEDTKYLNKNGGYHMGVLTALGRQLTQAKKALEETQKALANVDVERILNVKYGDPLLDELHYTNNDGSKVTMNESYKITNETVTEQGEAEKSRRLSNPGVSPVSYRNVRTITGDQVRKEIGDLEAENEESEIKRAIAYSLGDTNNKRATAILSSPYYKAKDWYGFFAYTMDPSEVDDWKTVSDDRKNAAKRSIRLFNKLVKQSAYLIKTINRPDILKKFLDDLDAMLQVPVPNQNANDTVILESADPAKPEYAVEITRRELIEIIRFLPMKAYLSHEKYGDGKYRVPLVLADIKNESNAYNEDGKLSTKFQWRYAMVKSFLQQAHNRLEKNKKPTDEQEIRDEEDANSIFDKNTGFDPVAEQQSVNNRKQKPYASTIHIKGKSIEITFEEYNQKFDSPQFNPESHVFYDPEGKRLAKLPESDVLTTKELSEVYTKTVQDMMAGMSEAATNILYSEFATELSQILGKTVTSEQLKELYPDSELTVLEKIILDGIRYGDGIILRGSFADNTISNSKVFGSINYKSTSTAEQSVEKNLRTDQLFELIQDRFANLFLSHKNPNLQRGTKQLVSSKQVEDYINNGNFTKTGDRNKKQPGSVRVLILDADGKYRTLGSKSDPVKTDVVKITDMLNRLDDLIDEVNNPQQFFDAIAGMGIKFEFTPNPRVKLEQDQREAFAIDLIGKYIRNRQFGRLKRVSSFTDMLISGTDHPNNQPVANKRFFAIEGQVVNSNLDKIDCLHIKEVDGVYYFDLADFASKSVRQSEVDDEGNITNVITDVEAERELIKRTETALIQEIEDILNKYSGGSATLDDIILYFNSKYEIYKRYNSFRDRYDDQGEIDLGKLNIDDTTDKYVVKKKILDAVDELSSEFRRMREHVEERLADILKNNATAEDRLTFLEDGKHARVQFAVGSYNESTGNARILRGDESGNLISMNEAVGQPGGVYLILPAFMNSSGKRRIVHLNGRKLGIHQANLIARLLDAVRTGKVSYNGNIPSDLIPGYKINTEATVNQLLESLIYIGTKAVENDSSASAFANLLFVDNKGQIHFGSKLLTDDNLSELVQFLQDRKQIRVDRAKLLNERANVGLNAKIELTDDSEFIKSGIVTDKSVFELNADENYQHYVISKGVIRSDINPSKNARMYNNAICAIDTPFTGNNAIPNPSNPRAAGSAASARNAATETFEPAEQFKNRVRLESQPQQQISQQPIQQFLQQQLATKTQPFSETIVDFYIRQNTGVGDGYKVYTVSSKPTEFTLDKLSKSLEVMSSSTKPDGSRYNSLDVSIVTRDGAMVPFTIVLDDLVRFANQIQQQVAQPATQPVVQQNAAPIGAPIGTTLISTTTYPTVPGILVSSTTVLPRTQAAETPATTSVPAAAPATQQNAAHVTISGYSNTNLTDIPGVITNATALNRVLVEKNGYNIFQMDSAGRTFVLANVNGVIVPFYMSSHGTDGKIKGKWYPFFGMTGTWLVKGDVASDGSMQYTKDIDAITKLLNDNLHLDYKTPIKQLNISGLKPYTFRDRFPDITTDDETYSIRGFDRAPNGKRFDAIYVEELTGIDASRVVNDSTAPNGFVTASDFIKQILNIVSNNTTPIAYTTPAAPVVSSTPSTTITTTSVVSSAPIASTSPTPIVNGVFTAGDVLEKIATDLLNDAEFKKAVSGTNLTDLRGAIVSMILNHGKTKYGLTQDQATELLNSINGYTGKLGELLNKYMNSAPFYGSAVEFLDNHVEKEDYASAQLRAIKILGDPEVRFTSDLPFTYDSNRKAFIYVFGQCAESFMRIYRSANGEIAAGVMDHEAFHRISLFVLSESERKRMYDDIRKAYPETANMADQQVEEFAADLFRDFVGEYSKQGVDGFYSNNGFVKFFQKLYDLGAKMLRKLFGIRTSPNYRGLQKLFEDMYSGRYAYAKATKDNINLFSMLYRTAPMSGVRAHNGVVVAASVSQYNQILRTLLDYVVNDSKLLDTVHNYTDIDLVMDCIKLKLIADNNGLIERAKEAYINNDFDNVVRWNNLARVYTTILTDDAWDAWKLIINNTLRRQFKITNQRSNPDQLLDVMEDGEVEYQIESYEDDTEETTESEGIEDPVENDNDGLNLGFESERDSFQRNMWNSAALSVKILFYTVTSEDSRNNKYDSNGLLNYGDPTQLYIKFTDLLQNCMSEDEMMEVLANNCDDAEVHSIYEHLTKDEDAEVNKSLLNKFFTSVCRYQQNFENNVYDVELNGDGTIASVEGRSVSGNMNEVTTKTRSIITRSIVAALVRRGLDYADSGWEYTKYQNELKQAAMALKAGSNKDKFREAVLNVLKLQYKYNGFGMFVEGDSDFSQSADMVVSFLWDDVANRVNDKERTSFLAVLDVITNSVTSITPKRINGEPNSNDKESVNSYIQNVIDKNVNLQNFLKNIGKYAPRQAKLMSQNGPKNVRIYTIGAFNYITRLFKLWTKSHKTDGKLKRTDWKEYLLKNPYAEHSLWLHNNELSRTKLNSRLLTMNDGDFSSAKSDKFVLDKEEYINRMITVLQMDDKGDWLGGHAFPVLANKKFSADLPGLPISALDQVVSTMASPEGPIMVVNESAKTVFANYYLDEVAAIKLAIKTRDNFINTLSEVLNTNYTAESFSNLGVSQQRDVLSAKSLPESQRADAVLKINEALQTLTVTYHFKSSKTEAVNDSLNRIVSFNNAHIDLTKGSGYKHRHFQQIATKLENYAKNHSEFNLDALTSDSIELRALVAEMLGNQIDINIRDIKERVKVWNYIPANLVEQFKKKYVGLNDEKIKEVMCATFVVRHMSDMLEYEKIVQGDMAYYGDGSNPKKYKDTVDKMTKRYSGPVSTFGQNASKGTKPMSLQIDDRLNLTEESTYNAISIQTTKLIDYDVFEGLVKKALGINVVIKYSENEDHNGVEPEMDYTQLLDENGKIKKEVLSGVFAPYSYFLKDTDDKIVAAAIVKDVLNRYAGYLSQDYTDASTFILSSMFRELRQRSDDGWTETEEACYLFMEHYDQLYDIKNMEDQTDWETMKRAAHILGITDDKLDQLVIDCRNIYNRERETRDSEYWNLPHFREMRAKYRGEILSFLEDENGNPKIDTTAMKYIYYGNRPQEGVDTLYIPVYDKTALVPLFKIFTEDHEAEQTYRLMHARNIHVMKYDSSTKSGGVFGYQLYDNEGNFNQDLYNAPASKQWFAQLSKQLDTDMHMHNDTNLLTQITKVIMLNSIQHDYNLNGEEVSGSQMNQLYSAVFNSLTKEGFNKFRESFGFDANGNLDAEGKQKLVSKLREVLEESGASQTVIDAFELDQNGDFVVNPALLPSMNQMQSRLLSQIGKIIVDTHMKGLPLYQVVSAGFDQDHPLKKGVSFDPELLSPGDKDANGNIITRMQARVSIMLFNDVINKAKKNKRLSAKYRGLTNFEDKRRFILDNKDQLCSIAYRVPTQGLNSTMAIDIVDVLPSTQGGIIQLPTTLTALTGADFDIDKLYTATYNYEVTDSGIRRVSYNDKYNTVEDLIAHMDELNSKQKENLLLDIYQTILVSNQNLLHTSTPLDVCTAPIKRVMTNEIPDSGEKNNNDGFSLTPMHQVQMRVQNSGSDSTIGPMALNSVFQYFTQSCDLGFIDDPQLKKIGIQAPGMEYIRSLENNEDGQLVMRIAYILDTTSAMINAAVDAAKDNYIGRSNINSETYDVVNLLIACGFGNNSFRFLAQPGVIAYVNSLLNASKDAIFREKAVRKEILDIPLRPEEFTTEALKKHINDDPNTGNQLDYVYAYQYLKSIAQRYRQAITVAQIDTKKYGKNPTELMSFLQNVDDFTSVYNLIFSTPNNLFDQSFLKEKLNAVRTATDMFGNIFMENSKLFKDAAELMCTIFNKRGSYSKKFLQRAIPKLKQVVLKGFFDQYIMSRFINPDGTINAHPLYTLFCDDKQSVIARYDKIQELCIREGIGFDFFDMIKHTPIRNNSKMPKFFIVDNKVNGNIIAKQKITDSIAELFHSQNPEVRQWITDVAVMQFYQTGGTDTSFGTAVRSSFYDMLPLRELSNIKTRTYDGSLEITLNEYVANNPYANNVNGLVNEAILQLSISDDEHVKLFKTYRKADAYGAYVTGDESVAMLLKQAYNARTDRNGARYAKYIKIQTKRTATPSLYVLGNVVKITVPKDGRESVYYNPIYYRVSRLGYAQHSNRANSIRVDGIYLNNILTSMFNAQTYATATSGKPIIFTAKNYSQLNAPIKTKAGQVNYAAANELQNRLQKQKPSSITIYDVDELGNVIFGADADPYFGMFDQNNPKSTNLVLSRLTQAPSDFNASFVQRAKEVGCTFEQLVRTEDGHMFIGTDKELESEVSLLVNSQEEIEEAVNMIFDDYPNVTSIKFISPSMENDGLSVRVVLRSKRENIGEMIGRVNSPLVTVNKYNRESVRRDSDSLYIFTDNTDRTSGGTKSPNSWYTEMYNNIPGDTEKFPVGAYGSDRNTTTAVIRGLLNAAPISTMKWFYKKHGLAKIDGARWTDKDYDQVTAVVEQELQNIRDLLKTGKFRRIVIPNNDFLLNSGISGITLLRTPRLYEYFTGVLNEIKNMASPDSEFVKMLNNIEQNKDSEEQRNKKC